MAKGNLKTNVSILTLVFALGLSCSTDINAESITYTGTQAEYNNLPTRNGDVNKRVIKPSSAEGNYITIQGSPGFYAPYEVFGGVSSTDIVQSNTVDIQGGNVASAIYGGSAQEGTILDNTVRITGISDTSASVFGGHLSGSGNVDSNTIDITGGVFRNSITGGFSAEGSANGNKVQIYNATVSGIVTGGLAQSTGTANSNVVNIKDGEFKNNIQGGFSSLGDVKNNSVHLSGEAKLYDNIYGGISSSGTGAALNNTVTIDGNVVVENVNNNSDPYRRSKVVGGIADAGLVQGNKLIINSGTFGNYSITSGGNYMGGYSETGSVKENEVYIGKDVDLNRGTTGVIGGGSHYGEISGNTVTIERDEDSSVIRAEISGGYGRENNVVSFNRVTIRGGAFNDGILGGASERGVSEGNIVDISNAKINFVYGGYVHFGIDDNDNVKYNKLGIHDHTEVSGDATAGFATIGNVIGNELVIDSFSTTHDIVYGGGSVGGMANNNKLSLSGNAHAEDNIFGGISWEGSVSGNSVSIEDAIVDENVYGGQSYNGNATDNSVTLIGQNIKIGGTVFGGFDDFGTWLGNDVFSGNTLNLNHFRGDIDGIQNFENYNWLLPKDVVNNDTLIHITGENPVNLANTKHKVMLENDGNRLNVGDKVTLIDKVENAPTIASMEVRQGNFLIYNMKLEQINTDNDGVGVFVLTAQGNTENGGDTPSKPGDNDNSGNNGNSDNNGNSGNNSNSDNNDNSGNNNNSDNTNNSGSGSISENNDTTTTNGDGNKDKTPTVAGRINPQTKSFSEARAAALGFLNQGADLIADAGIRAAKNSVADAGNNPSQMNFVPFLVVNGSSSRYKTGSHIDVDGFNMVVGLATGFELANKHPVTLGAFFEYGRGTYNSYNSFANYASVHGDGDTHYTGGGILGRIEFAGTGLAMVEKLPADRVDGLYAEASFRAGKIDTDFDTDDILTGYNNSRYDSKANYYGLHGGIGYVFNFDERNSLDVYARYFWTKIDRETVNIGRDRLHFDEANSSRIRIGGRYTYTYNEQLKPYIGVAYDHEFDGKIGARAYNLELDKPSLKGDTGIFEAGVSLTPVNTIKALSIDVTVQAFVGRREGGGGRLKIKYEF